MDIVRLLTVNNNRVVKVVDYVQGLLINDPCGALKQITDEDISDVSTRTDHTRMLEVSKNFLKNQYQYCLNKNDGCGTHSIEYALNIMIPIKIVTEVSKSFKGVVHLGRVIGYKSEEELYQIRYDDKDEEEMYKEELQ